jgi:hypothetical protein
VNTSQKDKAHKSYIAAQGKGGKHCRSALEKKGDKYGKQTKHCEDEPKKRLETGLSAYQYDDCKKYYQYTDKEGDPVIFIYNSLMISVGVG